DWAELQKSLRLNFESSPQRVEIRGILNGLLQELEPCITHRGATVLDSDVKDATVISFGWDRERTEASAVVRDEVRAILSEMILGGLAEYQDFRRDFQGAVT